MNGDTCFGQAPFIRIPPALFESGLNAAAIAVWCALARWVTDNRGHCWRTIADLALDTKLSEDTVEKAISALEGAGFLKVIRRWGKHSQYRLIWPGSDVVSMQIAEESGRSQRPLLNVEPTEQREKDEKRPFTAATSGRSQRPLRNAKPAQQNVSGQTSLYGVQKREEKERAFPDPLFSSTEKQGKSESNQDKAQADPMTPLAPVARHRRLSLDEAWQADQQDRLNNKHPGGKA
jgi:DNA-binding IscR family transcriptional regulator